MKRKKIHIALKYLSVYEINSFKKFLASPYFNQSEILSQYLDFLDEKIREGTDLDTITSQESWNHLFPKDAYDEKKFKKINSDINKFLEHFLAVRELEEDITLSNSLKIKAFRSRKMSDLYDGLISHINTAKKTQKNRSADYYLDLFNIEKNIFNLRSDADRKSSSKDPVKSLNIEEISLNLDVFYIAEKLKYYCTILSWSRSYKIDKKIAGIEFIKRLAQIPLFSEYPPIKIYFTISKTIAEEENTDHYFALRKLIDEHIYIFPREEAREIMDAAISYCVVKNNKGVEGFLEEVFQLYRKGLEENILIQDNQLSPIAFRNIVYYALRNNQLEWALQFIEDYSIYLDERYRFSAVNFSLARYEFYNKNYSKVIDHLNEVEMNDFSYNVNVRTLLLVSYYELKEWLAIDSLLQSFKAWVDREKSLTKDKKSEYLRLIKYVKRLINIPEFEKEKVHKLKDEVIKTPAIVSKQWLLEKIDERLKIRS